MKEVLSGVKVEKIEFLDKRNNEISLNTNLTEYAEVTNKNCTGGRQGKEYFEGFMKGS